MQTDLAALMPSFDVLGTKTAHLMLLALMSTQHQPTATTHAVNARRAGASWEELRAAVSLAVAAHGLSAQDVCSAVLAAVADREQQERVAGAVAAYG